MTLSIMYDKKCHFTIISVAGILISPIGVFRIHQYTSSFKDYAYVSLKYDIVMFDLSEGNDEHLR